MDWSHHAPVIEKTGVATRDEVHIDTRADRLRKEVADKAL
jgi:hypothetical protein